ncbi:MAG: LysM peptidoglycan-binding domain-containing protein [Thermodesulfobacteriota bacterium]
MFHKIIPIGLILFLSISCLPSVGFLAEKTPPKPLATPGAGSSLFTQAELDELFSNKACPSQMGISTPSSAPPTNEISAESPDLTIGDEPNDGFSVEVFPKSPLKKEPDFDIPIVINAKVEQFIQYFQTTARKVFSNWLARSEKYIPFMKNLLKGNGLPEDLVYMALIESGFNPYAYSRSKASGPWQFIYLTGKRYGLKVTWWVDERRDPEKSTIAATKYLKDLYDLFECWYLAAAGYNAGEGKIANAMKKYRTEDFWELTKYRYLKQETKDYVPQMIAAALIAKDPEKYGFVDIPYEEPLRYDKVNVPAVTDLRIIAKACEISLEELKDLNPELLRWCTPPDSPDYEIKIPFGRQEVFLENFEALQPEQRFRFKTHVVKRGDTLSGIARLYRVAIEPMLEINRIKRTTRLSIGTNLVVPVPMTSVPVTSEIKPTTTVKVSTPQNQPSGQKEIIYTIKKGDSLWSIANEMGVNIGALSRWNNLHPEKKLIPGDKLKIRVDRDPVASNGPVAVKKGKEIIYVVKEGDTLWKIAQKYNVTISEIKIWNHLDKDQIHPEDRLKLMVGSAKPLTLN